MNEQRFWQTEYFMPLGQEGQGGRIGGDNVSQREGFRQTFAAATALLLAQSSHASIVIVLGAWQRRTGGCKWRLAFKIVCILIKFT